MKLVASEDERDLRAMLHDLLSAECPTTLVRELREPGADRFPAQLWKALVGSGVVGLPFAEQYGGSGGRLDDVAIYHLEAGRALAPSIVASTLGLGLAIDALGDDEQRTRLLSALCAGDLRGVSALAAPDDADDVRPRLRAERDGDGWRITGTLQHVVDVDLADRIAVSAEYRDSTGEGAGTLVAFVDARSASLRSQALDVMGGPGQFRIDLAGVAVEAQDAVVDVAADDLRRVTHLLAALRTLELVGVAGEALRRAVAHVSERRQFGRPIGSFQAAQHLIANIHIAHQAARLAALAAVAAFGRGELAVREAATARMHATVAAKQATLDAHQLHGGMGYVLETDLHLWSERARVLASLDGTADTAARWLAEEVGLVSR